MSTEPESEDVELTIEAPDGERDRLVLPAALLDVLSEEGQSGPEAVGDMAMLTCANQIHHARHHSEGEDETIAAIEERTMERFEDRFGVSFAEATGHDH